MKKFILFFCVVFLSVYTSFGQSRLQDSLALVALYNSTNGASWTTTWDLTMPMDTWSGVSLNDSGRVSCLDLDGVPNCNTGSATGNNLVGTLPTEIGNLSELQTLIIRKSPNLTGSIPSSLYSLTNLQKLSLSRVGISGSISSNIQNLSSLTTIGILFTNMDGNIPAELGMLTGMTNLNLSFNSFSGTLPTELGNLTNLTEFRLNSNMLSGQLPSTLSNLTNAQAFDLAWNDLSGCFPTSYSALCSVGYINFSNNSSLPNGGDFTAFCNSGAGGCANCPTGDVDLLSQTDVDNFVATYPNCSTINGYLKIAGGSINDISGLSSLTTVNDYIRIDGTSLQNFVGLGNLANINASLIIVSNSWLNSLNGLNTLNTIGGSLILSANPSLSNLNVFNNLNSIGGRLGLFYNHGLTDLSSLNNLTSIGWYLTIRDNDGLINLNGLENLISIGGHIEVRENGLLTNLEGIRNINPVTISATFAVGDIIILDNTILSNCAIQSICDALLLPNTTTDIQNNAIGCNSRTEVETACAALPVELLFFQAKPNENNIALSWQTASEINNQGFLLQKSKDGLNWEEVIFIEGKGTTSNQQEYEYTDRNPFFGTSYYRLKQMDFDGQFEYSEVVSVRLIADDKELFISPNPAFSFIKIRSPSALQHKKVDVKVIDLNSHILINEPLQTSTTHTIDISAIPSGIYIIQIGNHLSKRFVKL